MLYASVRSTTPKKRYLLSLSYHYVMRCGNGPQVVEEAFAVHKQGR